ncbi:MAG: hypothetical protein HY769_00270 [Candidatus Stahlbacteria bacterium]|nr:hypothetical protein [Candidatus Stahlbacteria bacterium]
MGKIVTSGLIQSIKGSAGEFTYSSWKGVQVFKQRMKKRKKIPTEKEIKAREIFAFLANEWKKLSLIEYALWEYEAKRKGKTLNPATQGLIHISKNRMMGKNAFMAVNQTLIACGFKHILLPPNYQTKKPPVVKTNIINNNAYEKKIEFNLWLPHPYHSNCVAQIWGKRMSKNGYSYTIAIIPVNTEKTNVCIDKIRTQENKNICEKRIAELENSKIAIQIRTVAENGLLSMPSQIYKLEIKKNNSAPLLTS